MDDRQAFEEHPKLAAAILRAANEARMPLPLWNELLGEINAALTAARQDERRKAAEWHEERSRDDFRLADLADAAGQQAAEREWRTSAVKHLYSAKHFRSLATSDTGERNHG